MHLRELRDERALHAEERHRAELDLRKLDDPEGIAARLQAVDLPRTGDPEGRIALEPCILRRPVVDLRVDQALTVPLVDHGRVLEEHVVRDAELVRL